MDFCTMICQGRLTDEPEVGTLESGTPYLRFTIASNRRIKKGEEKTSYIPVVVFGNQVSVCEEFLHKGKEVHVEGNFETDSYVDKEGVKRKGFSVKADRVIFGKSAKDNANNMDDSPETPERKWLSRERVGSPVQKPSMVKTEIQKAQGRVSDVIRKGKGRNY